MHVCDVIITIVFHNNTKDLLVPFTLAIFPYTESERCCKCCICKRHKNTLTIECKQMKNTKAQVQEKFLTRSSWRA